MGDCWDSENMELMEDDCLQFIRVLFIDLFQNKYTKICTYLMLLFHVPLWSIQFYYFLQKLDIIFVVQYGPVSLVFLFAFISMAIPLVYANHLRRCFDFKNKIFWSLRVASEELQKSILRAAQYLEYITIVNIILGIIAYVFLLLRSREGKEWELIYQITFFKEKFPKYSHILIAIFYVSMVYFVLAMMWMIYILSYFALHTVFQARMANERVTKITENFSTNVQLIEDDIYQRQVFERLRFCIIRLSQLKSFAQYCLSIIPSLIVVYVVLAMLLALCYLGSWYLNPDKFFPLIVMTVTASGFSGILAVEVGQLVEDASLNSWIFLAELPWYTFNMKNRKCLLFTLLHSMEPLSVSPYEAFPVNRRMFVQFYKVVSSLSAFLTSSKEKIE